MIVSALVAGFGFAIILRDLTHTLSTPPLLTIVLLGFLPNWLRGLLLLGLGLAALLWGVWQWNRHIAGAVLEQGRLPNSMELFTAIIQRHRQRTGPKIVAIGGGTGMPNLLRGLRQYTDNITAVVTVADDGGSSGRLRRQMGVLPPGDFRNNIAALSDAEGLMGQLLQYRFADGDGLGGHNFGNIFITTMAAITGSFEKGIAESSRVLAVRGRILPSTLENVMLCAEVRRIQEDGSEEWTYVRGESRIPESDGQIVRVHLEPENARAYPETIRAILNADLIVAGPGSFFTSLMPNLLVPTIQQAICASRAVRLFVCNVATQPGETDHFSVSDHMRFLRLHAGPAFTTVLANDRFTPYKEPPSNLEWVTLPNPDEELDYRLFTADLIDEERPWRHDPQKLAAHIMEIYQILSQEAAQRSDLPA